MSESLARPLPEVMSHPVIGLRGNETVKDALITAREREIHHFPVFSHDKLVGMVCTCDFRNATFDTPVGEVMRPVVSLPADGSNWDAAQLMRAALVGSVVVLDPQGQPCGIVTRGDLARDELTRQVLSGCRCECCGAESHLRDSHNHILCVSCEERASQSNAFDIGGGD